MGSRALKNCSFGCGTNCKRNEIRGDFYINSITTAAYLDCSNLEQNRAMEALHGPRNALQRGCESLPALKQEQIPAVDERGNNTYQRTYLGASLQTSHRRGSNPGSIWTSSGVKRGGWRAPLSNGAYLKTTSNTGRWQTRLPDGKQGPGKRISSELRSDSMRCSVVKTAIMHR